MPQLRRGVERRLTELIRFASSFQQGPWHELVPCPTSGRLASRVRHEDIVDLAVVEGALRRRDAIVTSDPRDIRRIVAAVGEEVTIESV